MFLHKSGVGEPGNKVRSLASQIQFESAKYAGGLLNIYEQYRLMCEIWWMCLNEKLAFILHDKENSLLHLEVPQSHLTTVLYDVYWRTYIEY